jgi:hypothetical protein
MSRNKGMNRRQFFGQAAGVAVYDIALGCFISADVLGAKGSIAASGQITMPAWRSMRF